MIATDFSKTIASCQLLPSMKGEAWNAEVERIESLLLNLPQADMPVTHTFLPGQYKREVKIPAGTFAIGHAHRHPCFEVVLKGRGLVLIDGEIKEVAAPCILIGKPFQRKLGVVIEEFQWATIHPTNETDLDELEKLLLVKSDSFLRYQEMGNPEKLAQDRADFQSAIAELGYSEPEVAGISRCEDDRTEFPDNESIDVCFLPSRIEGTGMFASRDIACGHRIAPARISGLRTPAGRYTNHSLTPNARAEASSDGDVFFVASKDIHAGAEITLDYRQVWAASHVEVST